MRAAKLAGAAHALKRQSGLTPPFSLAFMSDRHRAPHPELIARVLPAGSAIILRDYRLPKRRALARRLKAICAARGVKLLVGADLALAIDIQADGVHYPRWRAPDAPAPNGMIVTTSAHNAQELLRADLWGADLAFLSPAFPSASHANAQGLGPATFRTLAARSPLPVLALGGVTEVNAAALAGPNVAGLAAIGAFLG